MNEYKVVISKSDKHPEYGYPFGQVLCRSIEDAQKTINESEFTDLEIKEYINEM